MSDSDSYQTGLPAVAGSRQLARLEPPAATHVVAAAGTAAGTAIVGAAKVGRLITRTGWGFARRLPGGEALQREVQRLQEAALNEVRRLLDIDGHNSDEQRLVMLLQQASNGSNPLRGAMSELLERSVESSRDASRDYLYGNIISQLVPDEARILAALADGTRFAAIDVVAKSMGRTPPITVLENASTVGRQAGVSVLANTPTYVTRLYRFGLVEFGAPDDDLSMQFDILATEAEVQAAVALIEQRKHGSPKLQRKSVSISTFGREFWSACDPSRSVAKS